MESTTTKDAKTYAEELILEFGSSEMALKAVNLVLSSIPMCPTYKSVEFSYKMHSEDYWSSVKEHLIEN